MLAFAGGEDLVYRKAKTPALSCNQVINAAANENKPRDRNCSLSDSLVPRFPWELNDPY
jgi:hypothetical protein